MENYFKHHENTKIRKFDILIAQPPLKGKFSLI